MEKLRVYVYEMIYVNHEGGDSDREFVAFVSPSDEFMSSIFEKLYSIEHNRGSWSGGDFEKFARHYSGASTTTWYLQKTLELSKEKLESMGIDFKLYEEGIEDIEKFDEYDNPFEIENFNKNILRNLSRNHFFL